jgi:indole-3-glycerol phosphate synthase
VVKTILNEIIDNKKHALALRKQLITVEKFRELAARRNRHDFPAALRGKGVRLIAEVKKASPSKGILVPYFAPLELAQTYEANGAAAISVLTEVTQFQGSLSHLLMISEIVNIPLLRKDFIFDEYQVYESAAFGADAILLITAILSAAQLKELLEVARKLNLACLVEVHHEDELQKALLAGAEIIGINNRDLNTFKVDTNVTRRLRLLVPEGIIVVSESGINSKADMKKMRECKVDAVLVGEALVTAADIPAKMKELLS